MAESIAHACAHPDCAKPAVRRCYFCPNWCCAEHLTVSGSGAICYACSAKEREKHEERKRQAQAAQAAAKGSGCLMAFIPIGVFRLVIVASNVTKRT